MRKIVAAMATMHAQQFFRGPQKDALKQLDAEPSVNRGTHPVGCLMTIVLQAEQRLLERGAAAH